MSGKKKSEKNQYIVEQRKCDVPMASKKHLLPCDGGSRCFGCVACMEKDQNGEWHHCDPLRGQRNGYDQPEARW